MLSLSENACGWALRDRVLSIDRSLNSFGNSTIDPMRITANDAINLLEQVAQGTLVNKEASSEFEALLLKQFHRKKIPSGITDGSKVANKTGELHRANSSNIVSHDTAIVRANNVNYVVVILTTLDPDSAPDNAKIADLAKRIHAVLTGASTSSICGSTSLIGGDIAEQIFNFFRGKGLQPWQAAGIIGNMTAESALNPQRLQDTGPDVKTPAETLTEAQLAIGWGLVQWTPASKMVTLFDPRSEANDLFNQLNLLWGQLEGRRLSEKQAGDDIKATTDVINATVAFQGTNGRTITYEGRSYGPYYGFERPRDEQATIAFRINTAKDILERFGSSSIGDPIGPTDPCTGGGSGVVDPNGYAYPVAPLNKADIPSESEKPDGPEDVHDQPKFAFDFIRPGGTPVYAIASGVIDNLHTYNVPGCYSLHIVEGGDDSNWDYWYGHIQNPKVANGQRVEAGQQIAEVADNDFGPACRGSTSHLHVDRGYPKGNPGGGAPLWDRDGDQRRDPTFLPLLRELFIGLPDR